MYKMVQGWLLPIKGYSAITIYPFVFVRGKPSAKTLRHEKIHLAQQVEMLLVLFYLVYFFNYLLNLLIYRSMKEAYRNISFEREAYDNDHDLNYLENRRPYSWIKYL